MFVTDKAQHHSLVVASSGSGKSVYAEMVRDQTRNEGQLLVDTELYREGKGLLPYEHEYARRIANHLSGQLPRELKGRPATIISDVARPRKRRWVPRQEVTTPTGIKLDVALIAEARDQLQLQTGIILNHRQLIDLMAEFGIDEILAEFGEAETQIRERLADALSTKLLGRSWPTCGALYNSAEKAQTGFAEELDESARAAGYRVA
jgi:hypothetical protein